jgi:hypothetical protein
MDLIQISIIIVLTIVVMFAPPRWSLLGLMAGVLYLVQGKANIVFGLNIYPVRFLEMAGFTRVIARRELASLKLNKIDSAFLLLYGYTTIVFIMRSAEGIQYQIGQAVDALLCYFTFRALVGDIEDFRLFLRGFSVLLLPFLFLVLLERYIGYNPFGFVGGHFEIKFFRDGVPRCMGSFRHPVLMGSIGASFLPIYIGLWFSKKDRIYALLGIGICLCIVYLANSGGPLTATAVGIVGWTIWLARRKLFWIRRTLLIIFALLALLMNAPVWYVLARVSSITGGDGWHRSYLIDISIKNIDKWWLAGMPILETAEWFPYIVVSGGADITNQFISFGITAGIVAMFLLIFLLIKAFQSLGKALTEVRVGHSSAYPVEYLLWGLGVMLSVHIINWLGVTYFDQFYVIWFLHLGAISSLSHAYRNSVPNAFIVTDGR